MRVTLVVPASSGVLEGALEGLVCANVALLERSQLPPLYRSGVRYQREPRGREVWQTCEQVYSTRRGDCEDLAAWRVAELRTAGEFGAVVIVDKSGPHLWHVRVMRASGHIEDPSAMLGME